VKPAGDPTKPDEKKSEEEKKAEADKKDGKPAEPKTVMRPADPPEKPNPDELKVTPDDGGMLRFNFRYQPWAEVLEWLARVSDMSLDWQELPGGFLNLSTQRAYDVREARDLINRHLLARGYTLLQNGEVLSVAKISEINPGMVPRVAADTLPDLMPHEFAKVSFELDWLLAEQAVEELKPMKSPNGTLTALKNTNRIEAMDAVINLREIYHLLQQEQSDSGQDNLIREFVLEHARAADVLASLESLLGLETKKSATPMSPQEMQQMQQMQQQMMQQRGGNPQQAQAPTKQAEVHLIVNTRKNSVVAHAPPDKMAIVEKAVEALDVATSHRDGLLNKPFQIHAYRLHSISPAPLVKTLQDVGDLDPNTRLEADEKSKSIVAYASLVDHATIQQLISNLDGSGRQFEVIQLRRLDADYVAGTIEFMMVGEKKEQEQPRYFSYYSPRSDNSDQSGDSDEFRVDADVENNMLLLWANEIEIESVRKLLVKLGEIPPEGGRTSKMRVLGAVPPEEAAKFLERLRQAWPSLAPNELNLPTLPDEKAPADRQPAKKPSEPEAKEVRRLHNGLTLAVFDAGEREDEEAAGTDDANTEPSNTEQTLPPTREELRRLLLEGQHERTATPPPVGVSIDPAGRLVITSQDTNALDLLEELVSQLAPPTPDYKIFRLLHVDAYYVKDNLEDFFKKEDDEPKSSNRRYYYYDYAPEKESKSRSRLSQRPKLKFIYDYDSNSILVQGASADQLATIEELIAVYDKPEPDDSQSARLSAVFQIEYSKASVIAEAIKDVYRDILSSNDKSLQQQGNPEAKSRQPSGTTYIFNEGEESEKPDRTHLTFKGKLSIGIDEVSNVLLVSAEGEQLMKSIETMIKTLDKAAQPVASVSVVKLGGNLNAEKVRAVLAGLLGDKQAAAQPAGENQPASGQRNNQPQSNNPRNNAVAPVAE
jgi:type II secretory pathway component GspD/PulD (secretin)